MKTPTWSGGALRARALIALCVVLVEGCSNASAPPRSLLVTGRAITPAGTATGPVGGMPLNVVISPDGKYAITTSSSLDSQLTSIRLSDGAIVSQVSFPTMVAANPNDGLFYGLVMGPGNLVYAAQGAKGSIAVVALAADGTLTQTGRIPNSPTPYTPDDQPAGLALDARGYLYATNYFNVAMKSPFAPPSTLSIYSTAGALVGRFTFPGTTSCFPLAVTVKSDGSRTYVASQRDGAVYVLDTSDASAPTLVDTIKTGNHPAALLLDKAQDRLFVANGGSDTISVVDTSTDRITATVLLRPASVANLPGVSPTGLALSSSEATLYATLGDYNAVAVIDTSTMQLSGYVPVGWYPTALAVTPDDLSLLVVNGWGTTAMNPNPQLNSLDPDPVAINFTTQPPSWAGAPGPGYVLNSISGDLSRIDVSKALASLAASTAQVVNNCLSTPGMGTASGDALSAIGVGANKIKHVIYIIKENRGYDQVLGDLPQGNGDPQLTLFGREVTPNQHALAERFILLDNFYNNAPVSGEGWTWCTQSMANEFVIRIIPAAYRLALATYQVNYAFEGQVDNYITGGFPARDPDGNPLSTVFTNGLPPIDNVAESPGGYLWDKVRAAGLTYRNYGFFLSGGVATAIPDNYPVVAGLQPPGHFPPPANQSMGITDYDFRKFSFTYADSDAWVQHGLSAASVNLTDASTGRQPGYWGMGNMPSRYSEWNREFQAMLAQDATGGTVPTFMMVRFGRDHTMGTNPGFSSPRAMMADNDYAVGELVQAVSNSPIWSSTAIFVVEDDAQFSPDHVDTHRSIAFVISPWIKQGTIDSRFYDTNSVLKSMELLLGLSPMSQYDAFANPIVGGWEQAPVNAAPYSAILPAQSIIAEMNPTLNALGKSDPRRRLAEQCSKMNFKVEDAVPSQILNQALWQSVKGPGAKVPALRSNQLPGLGRAEARRDEDGD